MANRRYNTQTTQPLKNGGRAKLMGGGMSTKKQLKASRDESYGKFGSAMKKKGKINR